MSSSRHTLDISLDRRLFEFAAQSWSAHEAVYLVQQMASLIPGYTRGLRDLYGQSGIGDARRAWSVVADLVSAMTGMKPTMTTLIELGFGDVHAVERIVPFGGNFSLAGSPVSHRLALTPELRNNLSDLFVAVHAHHSRAKRLLSQFQEELRAYDLEVVSGAIDAGDNLDAFGDLVHRLAAKPNSFPFWDDRPLFLDEQKAFLDYMAKMAGAEIVSNSFVDEALGEHLLRASGILVHSELAGEAVLDVNRVPSMLLERSTSLVARQTGNAVLKVLADLAKVRLNLSDWLYAVEFAVRDSLHIDISPAFRASRAMAGQRMMSTVFSMTTDLRDSHTGNRRVLPSQVQAYDFPELGE